VNGQPITIGMSACVNFLRNSSGQIVALGVGFNLTGLGVVCGVFSAGGPAGTITLSGVTVPTQSGFTPILVNGFFYCAVINGSGVAVLLLSTIPTGITAPTHPSFGGLAANRERLV